MANHSWAAATTTTPHPLLSIMDTLTYLDKNYHAGIIALELDAYITVQPLINFNATHLHYDDLYAEYFIALV